MRAGLVREAGKCEVCGHDPARVKPGGVAWALCVHEVAQGSARDWALDQRCAVLVVCWCCHMLRVHGGRESWPRARQLAALRKARPNDFDLRAFNALVGYGPDRVTLEDVDKWA